MNNELGKRMKHNYEEVSKTRLVRKMPVILRLDGKAFHTFTRGFDKPFDDVFVKSMQDTMLYLCENIQGCVFGYTQSDEITLILTDYKKITTDAWFDYEVQKMCSIAASMATLAFNIAFAKQARLWARCRSPYARFITGQRIDEPLWESYRCAIEKGAVFDCRAFNVPKEEVNNCLIWRQQDATRNSIQSLGQAHFSHKELNGKSCNEIQDMLFTQKDINWNDLPIYLKRGSAAIKTFVDVNTPNGTVKREKFTLDREIPIFSKDTAYVNSRIIF